MTEYHAPIIWSNESIAPSASSGIDLRVGSLGRRGFMESPHAMAVSKVSVM